jgi:ABC-type multidrug transport system ATPase subunit
MLELQEVTKRYGGRAPGAVDALRGITLQVPRGTITAVIGPNGAGKSTLFAVLLGFLKPTHGMIRIDGQAPGDYIKAKGVGYVPDRVALPPEWPVSDAILALARLDGLGRAAEPAAERALERFGLIEQRNALIGTLSRGLLQRVALAQALLAKRELVILDEPAAGLDSLWRIRLRATLDELRTQGVTVLLASHDLAEVERSADRAVLLEDGRVREILETRQASAPMRFYSLGLAMTCPMLGNIFPDATRLGDAAGETWQVSATDPAQLSARLAALLATGAQITSLQPLDVEPLETRVMRALDADD